MEHARISSTPARLKWFGRSDIGKVRKNNEDSFLALQFDAREAHRLGKYGEATNDQHDFAFAVSDGMGGAMAGEFASRIAVEKITTLLPRSFKQSARGLEAGAADVLTELFTQIHKALKFVGDSYEECRGMEATLSLSWFSPGWMYFAHVGDSRIYYLPKDGGIKQLSHDDTYVGWMFRNGQINEREARNHPRRSVLQKSLGGTNQFVDPQVGAVAYEPGDVFLLCSDGLTDGLYNDTIADLLRAPNADANFDYAHQLVEESLARSGKDNTTALIVQVL